MTPFVLASTAYGPMIISRMDTGVSWQLFMLGTHEAEVVSFVTELSTECLERYDKGVHIVDVGANVGTCTVPWAKHCKGWGHVTAFEPQERIYYALAGNVALNNLMNVKAVHGAVSNLSGTMRVPRINYEVLSNFGGIAMRDGLLVHSPGQELSYDSHDMDVVSCFALDDSKLGRLDILKIDVEGMEMDVLKGAQATIMRLRPIVITEWIHCGKDVIKAALFDFEHFLLGGNIVSVPMPETRMRDFVFHKLDHA